MCVSVLLLCVCAPPCVSGTYEGQKRVLKLELQAIMKSPCGCCELNQGLLNKQQMLFLAEPSLQSHI